MKPSSRVATKAAEAIVRPYQVCPILAKNHIAKIPIADDARVRIRAVLISQSPSQIELFQCQT
jgi:hypothetical protein